MFEICDRMYCGCLYFLENNKYDIPINQILSNYSVLIHKIQLIEVEQIKQKRKGRKDKAISMIQQQTQ